MKDRLLFLLYTTLYYSSTDNQPIEGKRNGEKETEDGWERLDMGYRKDCELRIEIGRNGNMASSTQYRMWGGWNRWPLRCGRNVEGGKCGEGIGRWALGIQLGCLYSYSM